MTLRDFSQTGSVYSFLDVTLDVSAERVTRGATELKLRPKSFQVLRYLAERAGRVVTREELLHAIWPDVVVTDESLTKCITDIRKALSDDAQKVIRTVARRGYVFAAPITRTLEFPRQADQQNEHGLASVTPIIRSRVLFSRVDAGVHMSIVSSRENGTESRTVYAPPTPSAMAHRSFLSPDGKHVLVVEMKAGGWGPCLLVPFESDTPKESSARVGRPVGPSPGQCSGSAWSPDGKWMYFSVNTGTGYHIWRQRFPDGAPQQVTFGATEEREITFDPDGGSFLTSTGTRQSTLWIHDASGERQITSEGYASSPRFSPDGYRLYYLLRSGANRRYVSGELWSANLETGKRERLLPEFLLADYSVSRNGNRILFVAIADDGATSVWMALLDGRTVPYRLSNVTAERAFFGADGEVFFLGADETNRRFLYRINEDGSGLQKAISDPIIDVYDVSPNGQSVAAWLGSAVQVLSIHGRPAITASAVCASTGGENSGTTPPCVSWSPNGRFLYLNDRAAGQIYALPIPHDRSIPALPDAGIASAKQAAAWPGVRVIREGSAFVGADPSVYAFFRVTTQRNIYRIGVPVEQE